MYEMLDTIADSYNPLLFIISIAQSVFWFFQGNKYLWVKLLTSAVIVYGVKYIDTQLSIWEYFGLDYSTHTAVAISLVIYLGHRNIHKIKYIAILALTFIAYVILMLYQGYHTFQDILSTTFFVIPFLMVIYRDSLRSFQKD